MAPVSHADLQSSDEITIATAIKATANIAIAIQ
jgi:hypothetical protein